MCPADVQSLFAGEVSDHQVRRCLDRLRQVREHKMVAESGASRLSKTATAG